MLVLSRKVDERILLGDRVIITVCGIEGGRVKLGIEAPDAIKVLRWELVTDFVRAAVRKILNTRLRTA